MTSTTGFGGCHNYSAADRLRLLEPEEDVYKTRMCCIYKDVLSEEAQLWLANRHNLVGEYRHSMSLKEKIQLCRYMFESSGMERNSNKWHSSVATILGKGYSKAMLKLMCKLAELDEATYELLQQMLSMHSNGKLKDQRLTADDMVKGPDMKIYVLSEIPALPVRASQKLLKGLLEQDLSITDFQKEAKKLQKLQTVQKMFIDIMGLMTWEEAARMFPKHTTREVLEHFTSFSLRRTPDELKDFCRMLKQSSNSGSHAMFSGRMGAVGACVECDALQLSEDLIQNKAMGFKGADLVIIDKPKDWDSMKVKTFLNLVTSLNANQHKDIFTAVALCAPSEILSVTTAITDSKHFEEPMVAFYVIPKGVKSKTLSSCVQSMVIARRMGTTSGGCRKELVWSSGTSDNFFMVAEDEPFLHNDVQVHKNQKPSQVYKELIVALSSAGQWILDVCCGTGTGVITSLREGRNVVGVDVDKAVLELLESRVATEVGEELDASSAEVDEETDEDEEADEEAMEVEVTAADQQSFPEQDGQDQDDLELDGLE